MADAVVIRIFVETYEFIMHREREKASLWVFNERELTPEIYCFFENGICMEYINGRRFDWAELGEKPLTDEKIAR
jgi:ethanolamine kinase